MSEPPFRPLPFLRRAGLQTILGAALHVPLAPRSAARLIDLPGGDRLLLEVSTPQGWEPGNPTVILVHGLCGCSRSPYLVRLARKLRRRGARAVRMNLRGAGATRQFARDTYHAGRTDDLLVALRALAEGGPATSITLIGFSLGGNIALKLAGELGEEAGRYFARVIAVCPPVDLLASSRRMSAPENRFFERMFVWYLQKAVKERHRTFPDLAPPKLPSRFSLYEFDELYTAPQCGFEGAVDYYRKSSALPLLPRIRVPCRILFAGDDPFVDPRVVEGVPLPPNVQVIRTERGGHLGFLGFPVVGGGFRWMDSRLLAWLRD